MSLEALAEDHARITAPCKDASDQLEVLFGRKRERETQERAERREMEARLWAVTQRYEVATKVDRDLNDGIAKMQFEIELYTRKREEAEARAAELEATLAAGFAPVPLHLPELAKEQSIGRYTQRANTMVAQLAASQTQMAKISSEMQDTGEVYAEKLQALDKRRSDAAKEMSSKSKGR